MARRCVRDPGPRLRGDERRLKSLRGQNVDHRRAAGDIAAEAAERLGERAFDHVDAAYHCAKKLRIDLVKKQPARLARPDLEIIAIHAHIKTIERSQGCGFGPLPIFACLFLFFSLASFRNR